MEEIFKNSSLWETNDGLISSAAWSDAGIDEYFKNRLSSDVGKILEKMNSHRDKCIESDPFKLLCNKLITDDIYSAINFFDYIDLSFCQSCYLSEFEIKEKKLAVKSYETGAPLVALTKNAGFNFILLFKSIT